jgi:hypothetical protein
MAPDQSGALFYSRLFAFAFLPSGPGWLHETRPICALGEGQEPAPAVRREAEEDWGR